MSTTRRASRILTKLGLATSTELGRRGISRSQVARLLARGEIERVGHGLYRLPDAPLTEHHSLAEASRLVPSGVVCLLTALRFHDLTTQNPFEVWMAVETKAWRPKRDSLKLRLVYFSKASFEAGIEEHRVEGVRISVYSAAKTVADCFKFRNKIGIDVAVEALKDYLRLHRGGANALARFARICRVSRVMQPYLDSIA